MLELIFFFIKMCLVFDEKTIQPLPYPTNLYRPCMQVINPLIGDLVYTTGWTTSASIPRRTYQPILFELAKSTVQESGIDVGGILVLPQPFH